MKKIYNHISITNGKIDNPNHYMLIGQGAQGVVFKLSEEKCVKIFFSERDAARESRVLTASQNSACLPKLYEAGSNYIIMEYIRGPSLEQYFQSSKELPFSISEQIVHLLKEMKRLKFSRLDARLRHILVSDDGKLKVIDHVHSWTKKKEKPAKLFKGLGRLGLLGSFFEHLQQIDPVLYKQWKT